nr:hypothetical protein StreXyl84_54970 [Streptomyces sp. Xyl84]
MLFEEVGPRLGGHHPIPADPRGGVQATAGKAGALPRTRGYPPVVITDKLSNRCPLAIPASR